MKRTKLYTNEMKQKKSSNNRNLLHLLIRLSVSRIMDGLDFVAMQIEHKKKVSLSSAIEFNGKHWKWCKKKLI